MKFKRKKTYGSYKTTTCPFCSRTATHKNEQGLDVCHLHTRRNLEEIKCTCSSWLELRAGKFGPYFNCINCGNLNYEKAIEIKRMTKVGLPDEFEEAKSEESNKIEQNKIRHKKRKEITITSDDPNYFS